MIKLSIILPIYNVSKYIIRCLQSISTQELNNDIELILVDDGSPDNSIKLAIEYLNSYPNLNKQIIHQKNKGLGGARNTGLDYARGEYIWFVDSDDEITHNAINLILTQLNKKNEIIVFDFYKVDRKGNCLLINLYSNPLSNINGIQFTQSIFIATVWNNIYNRLFLIKNNIRFKEHFYHEDIEFNMQIFPFATSVSYINDTIYKYHTQNINSIMNSIKLKNEIDLLTLFDTKKLLQKKYIVNNSNIQALNKYIHAMLNQLFSQSVLLSNDEYKTFWSVIKKNQKIILSHIKKYSIKEKIKFLLLLGIHHKIIARLIYFKKIK